jgi:acetyl-CoA acetyltransferase
MHSYQGVVITTPVTLGYARTSDHATPWFFGSVLRQLLEASGLAKHEVDGLAISSFSLAPDSVVCLTQHFDMSARWLEQLPYGGASGVIAVRRAARAIQCGDAEVIACIGADTNQAGAFGDLVSAFSSFSIDASYPYGAAGPNLPFALITDAYMRQYGARREDFGHICIAQRHNARHNPDALLGHKALDMAAYLGARQVAGPLHLFDCVMPCAGAEGFLLMSEERARRLGLPFARVLAAEELHNACPQDPVQLRGGWQSYASRLYNAAGVGPAEIDVLQTYDDYPVICMLQMEGLGFCAPGEAAQFVRETPLGFDAGGLPHNTGGGQLSVGQAGAAGGFMGVVEALRQVTHCAAARQVAGARFGLASGYGMINYDRGLCSAALIIEGEDA